MAGILAVLGGGGGILRLFTTQSAHTTRLDRLEYDREDHADKIGSTHTTVTALDTKVDHISEDVGEIRSILENYRSR